jgi:hypothetical protein
MHSMESMMNRLAGSFGFVRWRGSLWLAFWRATCLVFPAVLASWLAAGSAAAIAFDGSASCQAPGGVADIRDAEILTNAFANCPDGADLNALGSSSATALGDGEGSWKVEADASATWVWFGPSTPDEAAYAAGSAQLITNNVWFAEAAQPWNEIRANVSVTGAVYGSGSGIGFNGLANVVANFTLGTEDGSVTEIWNANCRANPTSGGDCEGTANTSFLVTLSFADALASRLFDLDADIFATATARAACASSLYPDCETTTAAAEAIFGNTFKWGGIELFLDGVPLDPASYTAFDVDNPSVNWATAVPEPGTALVMGSVLLGLAGRSRLAA